MASGWVRGEVRLAADAGEDLVAFGLDRHHSHLWIQARYTWWLMAPRAAIPVSTGRPHCFGDLVSQITSHHFCYLPLVETVTEAIWFLEERTGPAPLKGRTFKVPLEELM